ncbi:MAG: hypothetical protein KAV82_12690 [Phycisphaerae bacterium]|nr:hypothetical protein [Phycisphaerae bacterium]
MRTLRVLFVYGVVAVVGVGSAGASETLVARLNINAMVDDGDATVVATESSTGGTNELFDGDWGTLYRTPNINPAVVEVTFVQAQTVHEFKTMFSNSSGSPAYLWQVESADTAYDMENQTGSWELIVPPTGADNMVISHVVLGTPKTAYIFKYTAERLHGDGYVHIRGWELHGEVVINSLSIDPDDNILYPGQVWQYICNGLGADGRTYDLTDKVQWSSALPQVASIGASTGLCEALLVGLTAIRAQFGSLHAPDAVLNVHPTLAAPANLHVGGFYSTALVEWDEVVGEHIAGYEVYRRTAGTLYPPDPSKRVLVRTSFTDYNLTPGETYYYKVVAIDGNGAQISHFTTEQGTTLETNPLFYSMHANRELLIVFYTAGYTSAEVAQMTAGLEKAIEFYWRTTACAFNMDTTWMYIDAYPPGGNWYNSSLQDDLRSRGMQDDQYDLAFLAGKDLDGCFGGYVVFGSTCAGLGTVCSTPYPGKDPNVNYTIAWTFTHEMHHALEAMENRTAGTPEVLFCHFPWCYPDPLGPTGWHVDWGTHWDGIAMTNRGYGDDWLLYPAPYDGYIECIDIDHDGLPDDDSRVWGDEARFGSNRNKSDTDGDGLDDLAEFSAYNFRGADPNSTDTDGDGTEDGMDHQPIYPVPCVIPQTTNVITINGVIDESDWQKCAIPGYYFTKNAADFSLTTYMVYNDEAIYFAFQSNRSLRFKISIDGSGEDGRFESPVRHVMGHTDTGNPDNKENHIGDSWADGHHIYTYHNASDVEVWGSAVIPGAEVASTTLLGPVYRTEVKVSRTLPQGAAYTWYPSDASVVNGLTLLGGRVIGINITFSNTDGSDGAEFSGTWTNLFETHSFVDFELQRRGDYDRDADVDLKDFAAFQGCFTDPGGLMSLPCRVMDFDSDNDVDLGDYAEFEKALVGP